MNRVSKYGALALLMMVACRGPAENDRPPADLPEDVSGTAKEPLPALRLSEGQAARIATVPLEAAGPVPRTLPAAGVVEALPGAVALVSAPDVSRVVKVLVEVGQSVKRGETLLLLDTSAVAVARADMQRGQALSARAEQLLRQEQVLASENATSERDRTLAEQELLLAKAQVEDARGRLQAWGASGGSGASVAVGAPLSGVVSSLHATVGGVFDSGALLMRIVNPQAFRLRIWVPQTRAFEVSTAPLTFSVPGAPQALCAATSLGYLQEVDSTLQAVPFRAEPEAACLPYLLERSRIEAELPLLERANDAALLRAPLSALTNYDERPLIFVTDAEGREYRPHRVLHVETWGEHAYFQSPELSAAIASTPGPRVATQGLALLKGELMRSDLE